jgi:hypothetical protein
MQNILENFQKVKYEQAINMGCLENGLDGKV